MSDAAGDDALLAVRLGYRHCRVDVSSPCNFVLEVGTSCIEIVQT